MRYAQETQVPVERSKAEIERTLQRYGAREFASGWKQGRAIIQFVMMDRVIRFILTLPDKEEFRKSHGGRRERSDESTYQAWEQACRQRWRALGLAIKSKLESAEGGIEAFETAFMGQIVMPDGKTIAETVTPMIAKAYSTGKMPELMLEY